MPRLKIPSEHRDLIHHLASLDQADFDSVVKMLEEATPTMFPSRLTSQFEGPLEKMGLNGSLVTTLLAMYRTRSKNDLATDEFVSDLIDSINSEELTDDSKAILSTRLQILLQLDSSIGITAKAAQLVTEGQHVFCDARIITDVRPIFTDDPTEPPKDAVLLHSLRIGYHEADGEHRSFYVMLDVFDLLTLKVAIERAEVKEGSLCSMLEPAGINVLGLMEVHSEDGTL